MLWLKLFHLGDVALTLPIGSAIAAWLLAAQAWRAAAGWCLAFGLALALVAASKIAFLGWDAGLPALRFKAASGHAAGYAVVFPMLCWLLAWRLRPAMRAGIAMAAFAFGLVVVLALVRASEHTPAEAIAGWLVGGAASLCAIHLAADAPAPRAAAALPCALFAFVALVVTAWLLRSVSVGHWVVVAALVLSGNVHPYSWGSCG